MSIILTEGFDSYGTTDDVAPVNLEDRYSVVVNQSLMRVQPGRFNGKSIRHPSGTITALDIPDRGELICAVNMRVVSLPAAATASRTFWFAFPGEVGFGLYLEDDGSVTIRRSSTTLDTILTVFTDNDWHHVEFHAVNDPTTGSYELRLDGSAIGSGTGLNTRVTSAVWGQIVCESNQTACVVEFDDVVVLDTNGSVNNDFIGVQGVFTLFPNAAGSAADFTPDSGDNYARVNENPHDGDTSYVESNTRDHTDLHEYANLPGNIDTISGVVVNTIVRKTDEDANVITVVNGDDDAGQVVDSDTYIGIHRINEVDPDTTDPWELADVNASEFGYKMGE